MTRKSEKPILHILAGRFGVYEVALQSPANEYQKAERLSAAIRPAISIIDGAIREVFGETLAVQSREKETSHV